MNKNQKMIFKGYLLFFLGIVLFLLSIILMIIYANVLRNPFGDFPIYIIFCLAIVGYSISISSSKYNIMLITNFKTFIHPIVTTGKSKWFIQGIPNNKYSEFSLCYYQILKCSDILFKEIKKGVYVLEIEDKSLLFDMRGWIRKEYYILEYVLTILQLEKNKNIHKKNVIKKVEDLKITFLRKNGKVKQKNLIKKHKTCMSVLFRSRLYTKYRIISTYDQKGINNVKNYFHFNI